MADYIDKYETIRAVRKQYLACDTDTDYGRGIQQGFDFAMSTIEQQPAADVVKVEIVRCRNCKHYYSNRNCLLFNGLVEPEPDDYCSYGEARE